MIVAFVSTTKLYVLLVCVFLFLIIDFIKVLRRTNKTDVVVSSYYTHFSFDKRSTSQQTILTKNSEL